MMKLFIDNRWLSPYSFSAFCALKHKGLPFELIEVPFEKGVSLNEEFKTKSITGLIPAFEDGASDRGSLFLSESLAIVEYLEEKFPAPQYPSVLPESLSERATARMLLCWYRSGFRPLKEERSMETVFYPALTVKTPLSAESKEEVSEWMRALSPLLKRAGSKGYLFGNWGLVDAETALMAHRLIRNGDSVDANLKAFAERICNEGPAQEFMQRERPEYKSYYR